VPKRGTRLISRNTRQCSKGSLRGRAKAVVKKGPFTEVIAHSDLGATSTCQYQASMCS
jgi:hypothetical protein